MAPERCPACQAELPPASHFCTQCGAALALGEDSDLAVAPTGAAPALGELGLVAASGRFVPGTILASRFRVTGLLARGGMGEVYRADDLRLGQPVALKFLPEALAQDPGRLERFLDEVRLSRRVSHPNVCRVHELFEADGHSFLSMEFVDGEDLASLLRRIGRLPAEKAVDIARQICYGLATAHAQGVLHRDLKPENIMLDSRGRVRLMDFGIAALIASLRGSSARQREWGTPAYMAPEHHSGGALTLRSDLYSLGIVLYELFTGRRPFVASTKEELGRKHSHETPTAPSTVVPDIDPQVEAVILRCLSKEPSRRPSSAMAIAGALPGGDPLAAALAAGQTPAPELVAAAGEGVTVSRRRATLALASTLVFVGAMFFLSRGPSLSQNVPLSRSADALADRARDILTRLGHDPSRQHSARGFEIDRAYLNWVAETERDPGRWDRLLGERPPAITFWLRTSPEALVGRGGDGRVMRSDPPQARPGMATVVLDTQGRLVALDIVPRAGERRTSDGRPAWQEALGLAGLDPTTLTPAQPTGRPLFHADTRLAWDASGGEWPQGRAHVEVDAAEGALTRFEVRGVWSRAREVGPGGLSAAQAASETVQGIVLLGLTILSLLLARHNLRLGRGDRRSAARLAAVAFFCALLSWQLGADHTPDFGAEMRLALDGLGVALRAALIMWVLYLAVEPQVRRLWPHVLISWTRLIYGRWRDPLVGRDVLVGLWFGALSAVLLMGAHWLTRSLGLPPPIPEIPEMHALLGLRQLGSIIAMVVLRAIQVGMVMVVLFVLLRALLHKEWLAVGLFLLVFAAVGQPFSGLPVALGVALRAIVIAPTAIILLRYGLVTFMASIFTVNLFSLFCSSDLTSWAIGPTLTATAVLAGAAVLAYRVALGDRSSLGEALSGGA